MKHFYTSILFLFCLFFISDGYAQPWTYDFGTATGSNNAAGTGNIVFLNGLTTTPAGGGTYRIRTGGTPGTGFVVANPGTALGTLGELQINASTSASTNKFGIYDWTSPTTVAYAKFKLRTTATLGIGSLAVAIGVNTLVTDNNGYTSHYNNSVANFSIIYSAGAVSVINRRINGSNVTIAAGTFLKDTNQDVEVYCNNGAAAVSYNRAGTSYTLNSQQWDLWVGGSKISPALGWAKAGTLASGLAISGIGFFGELSTGANNNAFMYLDDIDYSNALPICPAPVTQATNITFPSINQADMDISWTSGSGAGRVVKMNTSNSFTAPANGSNPSANLAWQNAGEQVVYNGAGSGPITISNLSASTTYHYRVYEYCDAERTYQVTTATGNPNSQATAAGPSLSTDALTAFGAQCVPGSYGPNSFTITGANLTAANVTVGSAITQYTFSTNMGGPFLSSLSLGQAGGAYSQLIYVQFDPTGVATYNGLINIGGGGASTTTLAVSGSGIAAAAPTLNTPTFASVTSATADLGADITSLNCSNVTDRGIEWSTTNGFIDGSGTTISELGTFGTGAFTEPVTGLPSNTTIYWKAYATNSTGTTRTAQQSFATSQIFLNVGDISILGYNSNTPDNFAFVNWVSIPANVVIKFTDGGFNGTAPNSANTALNARGTENFVIWKNNTGLPIAAGTVIKIESLTTTLGIVTAGSGAGLSGLSGSGDQVFAYQGNATTGATPDYAAAAATTTYTGNILFGLNAHGSSLNTTWLTSGVAGSNDSYLPTELNVVNGNIALTGNAVGGQYTGTRTALGSILAYRALVNNQANWTKVTVAGLVAINTTAFTVNPNAATQVVVTGINGGINPSTNTSFNVSIETRDALNAAAAVGIDTDFAVTLVTGSGALGGTLTGTITAGNGTLNIPSTYNTAEGGVSVLVSATAGMTLTAGTSATFTVDAAASQLTFVGLETYAYTSNNIPTFTVEARRPDNSVDVNYSGSATITLNSGTGNVLGTVTKPITAGVAIFNDISFDQPGVKQIDVNAGALPATTSSNITVSTASLTEVILPEYIEGKQPTNTNRMPYAYRVTLNGLKPNSTFRYINGVVLGTDPANSGGAGNAIYADIAGFIRSGGTSLSTAGNYGEFTTDGSGSYTGWFITEPTGNATRFNPGADVYCRISLNNGNNGTATTVRLTTANSVKVIEFGALAAQGTALRGNSGAPAKNFVFVYDNTTGSGRPIAGTFVESDGSLNDNATNSYSTFYATNVEGIAGAYGLIIPNTLPNGIRRIEQRQFSDGAIAGCASSDADGIWPGGANTVNPTGGTATPRVILSTDAPLIPSPEVCGNYIDDNCDGNIDEGCPGNFLNDIPSGAPNVAYSSNMNYPNCYSINGDNTIANNSAESGTFSGPDSWYKFVAQTNGAAITMTSSTMDDAIALYTRAGNTYTLIATENVATGNGDFERMVLSTLVPGTTYYISVGAATGAVGGAFTLCIQHLMPSGCAYTIPAGGFSLCSSYKAIYRGSPAQGVTYSFNFTGIGGGASGLTTISGTNGLTTLSGATLALRYGGIYDVTVDVRYTLKNGLNVDQIVNVLGSTLSANCSNVSIMTQPNMEVKLAQQCNAVLLRSNYLIGTPVSGSPNVCSVVNYTYEFTQVTDCSNTTPVGLAVEYNTPMGTPYLPLGNLGLLANTGTWRVRIRPNFGYGTGIYGPAKYVAVSGTSASVMINEEALLNDTYRTTEAEVVASIYPNPNSGEMLNINLTDVTSEQVYVRIMDVMGRVVYSNRFAASGSLNTIIAFDQSLSSGVYMIEFNMDNNIVTEKMIVRK